MKVAFIENMNNNFFCTARYLRDRGIDVSVLPVPGEPDHFSPASDSYDSRDMEIVKPLPWGTRRQLFATSRREIRETLKPYDFLIGCGLAPAYALRAGRSLDIFVPYGGDLLSLCAFEKDRLRKRISNRVMSLWQRPGIRRSRVIHMTPTNDLYETMLKKVQGKAKRWTEGLPAIYTKMYEPERLASAAASGRHYQRFKSIRDSADIMVMSQVRQVWGGSPSDPNQKGTDRLFRGWASFLAANPGAIGKLVLFESKSLLEELGVAESVEWMPLMQRREIMPGLAMADLACGEFENSWICSGVLYEAMTAGRPLVSYRDDSLYEESACYPIFNAKQPNEIAEVLQKVLDDPDSAAEMGRYCREWFQNSVVDPVIDRYEMFIKSGDAGAA
jgi:glycosyltransferase involved in cell wall biosynthesis